MPVSLSSSPLSVHAATNTDQTIQKYPRCYLYKLFSDESRERLTFSETRGPPEKYQLTLLCVYRAERKVTMTPMPMKRGSSETPLQLVLMGAAAVAWLRLPEEGGVERPRLGGEHRGGNS